MAARPILPAATSPANPRVAEPCPRRSPRTYRVVAIPSRANQRPSPSTVPTARPGASVNIEGEVPQLLDLLAAGSTAGLSAELSLRRAAEALRGPLGEDLRGVEE